SSLSTNAAMEASKYNGITVGVCPGKKKEIYGEFRPTVLIPCGLEIGGRREFSLVLSCDVIIAIGGGSGTLTEMAIAYQAGIPIVTVNKFNGWAKKLSNKYFDDRKRLKCVSVDNEKDALDKALELANK
ncbi:MAG: TIGR00725 family protein, partial [Bacilli bacterium]|nr:TIGR00725 family protein [Bacilli bacterium]